jgi:hypothetical protein
MKIKGQIMIAVVAGVATIIGAWFSANSAAGEKVYKVKEDVAVLNAKVPDIDRRLTSIENKQDEQMKILLDISKSVK